MPSDIIFKPQYLFGTIFGTLILIFQFQIHGMSYSPSEIENNTRAMYLDYMVNVAKIFGADVSTARKDSNEIIDLLLKLAKVSSSSNFGNWSFLHLCKRYKKKICMGVNFVFRNTKSLLEGTKPDSTTFTIFRNCSTGILGYRGRDTSTASSHLENL